MARKLGAVAALVGLRIEEELVIEADARSMITGFARAAAEVAATFNMTAAAARHLCAQAEILDRRLPRIAALLAAGHLDWPTVEVVIARTELVAEDTCAALDTALAAEITQWRCWSRKRLIDAIDQQVHTLDAEAAKRRRVVAFDARGVHISAEANGTARMTARLSALAGTLCDRRLSAMATGVCRADPRALKQRRADALVALFAGHTTLLCRCDTPDCPNPEPPENPDQNPDQPQTQNHPQTPGAQVVVSVIATAATVAGHSEAPGYLAGFGVVDADQVRELARNAVHTPLYQPPTGEREALRYRPSAALQRWIRCRDLTCRFPGCTVPAQRCDIDHTEPFNHSDPRTGGPTVAWNLACYCREHHRLKTFHSGPGGWQDRQLVDGTILWTAPTGATYSTAPGGSAMFPELRQTRPARPEELTRIAAARARLAAQRPADQYHRYRNRAAAQEIQSRQFRNRFRRTRALFHGETTQTKPSTSPFCRWVNDPIEPEQLPPNWQPPPQATPDPDEPPPF